MNKIALKPGNQLPKLNPSTVRPTKPLLQFTLATANIVRAILIFALLLTARSHAQELGAGLAFDVGFYMRKNPDIARFYGGNPASARKHWIEQGIREGRESSPVFNIAYYTKTYPDVAAIAVTGKNKAVVEHWLKTGVAEGRQGTENFNVKAYFETLKGRISDLTYEKAFHHYLALPPEKQTAFIKVAAPAKLEPMVPLGKEAALKGVFHMEVDDTCDLYVNGTKVHSGSYAPSKSEEISLKPGDRVVAQLKSLAPPKFFKLLFVSSDKRQMINFSNSSFKILPDAEATDFTPVQYNSYTRFARELKGTRNPFPFKNKSEYMWGESEISTLGSIIIREMFVPLVL